jgi:hypothetical protein
MHRHPNPRASAFIRVPGFVFLALLLAACVAGPPPRAATAPESTAADAPTARAALAQFCANWRGCTLVPVDVTTAAPVPGLEPLAVGDYAVFGFSPDRRLLATIAYPRDENMAGGALLLTDLATWQTVTTTLTFDHVMLPPLFSADNRRLYLVEPVLSGPPADKLVAVDVAAQEVAGELVLPFPPHRLAVTPDGSAIHLYGRDGAARDGLITNPTAQVARVDAAGLSLVWEHALEGVKDGHFAPDGSSDPHEGIGWEAASVFTSDASTLYIAHADGPRLTTVVFEPQAPAVATAGVAPRRTWGEWLRGLVVRSAQAKILNGTSLVATLAPDGSRLYVGGTVYRYEDAVHREESSRVQVIELPEGTALPPGPPASGAYPDASGAQLFLANWRYMQATPKEWTEVVDAATLEQTAMIEGWVVRPSRRLDGQPVLLGQRNRPGGYPEVALFDAALAPQAVEGGLPGTWSMWVMP